METIYALLERKLMQACALAFGQEVAGIDLTQSTQPQFGEYQCNNALKLAKELKISPRQAAEKIVAHFEKETWIQKLEIAGPGFINIFLEPHFISSQVLEVLNDPRLGAPPPKNQEKIVVEFSSPNVAKELHVGHLRSTIIGECLARLFEFLGHDVLRLNHIGDWGTQFGMLITYMQEAVPDVLNDKKTADLPSLMGWYRESKKRFDADPEFKKRAQQLVVKLQGGDESTLKAWKMICEISRIAYQQIYDLLDVKLTERGESFYNPMLPPLIQDLEKKGLITLSGGAKCIYLDGFTNREGEALPMIVQKADGGFNYDTTDMAALTHRIAVENADRIIYVVDAGQSLHFQMLFKAAEVAGYLDPRKVRAEHAPFGVVLGTDGKKFKTRSGETERLIDLLEEAITQAKALLKERIPDLSATELDAMGHILGLGAVKYADLSCHRIKDYVFSYERMLRFEGNTAAFLLYAYVRIQSIKRKVGKDLTALLKTGTVHLEHPSELALGLHVRQFGETLELVARDLLPHRLTDYLYLLAEKFHAFFRDCRVEGSPQEASRLLLCEAAARVLAKGLEILGLKTLDRM